MRVLVTGGAGYVGSMVVRELLSNGHHVWALDNLVQGHRDAVTPGAIFLHGDIGDGAKVREILKSNSIDAVVHTAAATVVSRSIVEPRFFLQENVVKASALLNSMMDCGVSRLVFSSTASVYGLPRSIPIGEDHPATPYTFYGESKLMFERTIAAYGIAYGLKYIIFRYFNAAGAFEELGEDHRPESHAIPLVFRAAKGGEPFQVFGTDYPTPDGTCVRDYVHVCDIAAAHRIALEKMDSIESGVFNLGAGRGVSVRELVATAETFLGRRIPVTDSPRRPGDPPVLVASPDRAVRELGWNPARSYVDHIIASAWDWHQRHPEGYGG